MAINFSHLVNLLSQAPGNLINLLVISFGLILTGAMAVPKLNAPENGDLARHVLIGCSILFILQIVLFSASLIGTLSPIELSLLGCLTSLLTIIWVVWLFHGDDPQFSLTGISIFLTLALVILNMANLILINLEDTYIALNAGLLILGWQIVALILIALGLILTLRKRSSQWVIAVCILALLAIGHGLQLVFHTELQLGSVRLAQIVSLPWIISLTSRFGGVTAEIPGKTPASKAIDEAGRVDPKPMLVDYLLEIPLQKTAQEKYQAVARAISLSVVADICCIFKLNDEAGNVDLIAGYDLIREEYLKSTSLPQASLSQILSAWRENRLLKFSKSYNDCPDLETLKSLINYPRLGNLLAYPLVFGGQLSGGVVILSPYTDKNWDEETTTLLEEIHQTLAELLFTPVFDESRGADVFDENEAILYLQREKDALHKALNEKETRIQEQENALGALQAKYQIDRLEAKNQIDEMQQRLAQLSTLAADRDIVDQKLEQLQTKIRHLTNERNQLKSELAKAQVKLDELKTSDGQTGPIRLSMDTQVVSLDSIMANVRLRIASQLATSRSHLEIINPDGYQMIKTDPDLAQQILYSLLDNAIKASKPGGKIQVRQKLSLETGMLEMQITDYGEGLTEAEQKSLFSPEPEVAPGIGSIQSVREAIRAIRVLNGKIWLKSKKGAYTTFRVHLPVRIID